MGLLSTVGPQVFGHVGLIVHGDDGQVHLIHSTRPAVREQPIDEYIRQSLEKAAKRYDASKPRLLGFKFLRLTEDPWVELRALDGPDAPRVTLPKGGRATFE